jgi:quinol monooxygenase YgiN
MTGASVYVIARLCARPGCVEALKEVLAPLVGPTRQTSGCVRYELLQNHFEPTELTFVEVWSRRSDLYRHLTADYLQDIAAKLEHLLASPPQIALYGLVDEAPNEPSQEA